MLYQVLVLGVAALMVGTLVEGTVVGCSHDGSDYRVGDIIRIGCDDCVCQAGHIKCPEQLSCPRPCFYKEHNHDHGTSWYNSETCDDCTCNDGTTTCIDRECPDKCSVNGMNYDVGERFQSGCEMCVCHGNDQIHCEDRDCPCLVNNKILFHGDTIEDVDGLLVYMCNDGRLVIEEDNRGHRRQRYLTRREVIALEKRLQERERQLKMQE